MAAVPRVTVPVLPLKFTVSPLTDRAVMPSSPSSTSEPLSPPVEPPEEVLLS